MGQNWQLEDGTELLNRKGGAADLSGVRGVEAWNWAHQGGPGFEGKVRAFPGTRLRLGFGSGRGRQL